MKATAIIAALTLGFAAAGAAHADQANYPVDHATSTVSRTAVLNELHLAQAQGQVLIGEQASLDYPQLHADVAAKTRAEVLTELADARAHGSLVIGENESYPL